MNRKQTCKLALRSILGILFISFNISRHLAFAELEMVACDAIHLSLVL